MTYGGELLEKEINTADGMRPGLEMTGYFDYERIQPRDEGVVLFSYHACPEPLSSCEMFLPGNTCGYRGSWSGSARGNVEGC